MRLQLPRQQFMQAGDGSVCDACEHVSSVLLSSENVDAIPDTAPASRVMTCDNVLLSRTVPAGLSTSIRLAATAGRFAGSI